MTEYLSKEAPIWWKSECPKYDEPCSCKVECMYLRQKSLRKLDVIVAEKVMGHKIVPNNGKDRPDEWAEEKYFIKVDFGISLIPPYSTDIAAAFEVATHLQKQGYYVCIELKAREETSVGVYEENQAEQIAYKKAQTPAEAICKAALSAVTGEEVLDG